MTVGMMADRSSVIGLTMERQPDWSFSRILVSILIHPTGLESPWWRCTTDIQTHWGIVEGSAKGHFVT